jgi:hypothetical protein
LVEVGADEEVGVGDEAGVVVGVEDADVEEGVVVEIGDPDGVMVDKT